MKKQGQYLQHLEQRYKAFYCLFPNPFYLLIFNLTSLASFSRSDFLSQDLKVSKVLVLYNVPKAGQQRAGIEAFLNKRKKPLGTGY